MTNTNEIYDYLNSYFTPDDLVIMKKNYFHDYTKDDCLFQDSEYNILISKYKALLGIGKDTPYRIEVDERAGVLMGKLYKHYVTDETLLITATELNSYVEKDIVDNIKNKFIITYGAKEHLANDLIDNIIRGYKKLNCKNIFIMLPSVCPCFGYTTSNVFFKQLKQVLINLNIPHLMVLDDCQGVLYDAQEDYSIFDAILMTAHNLILGFDMGILITKLKDKIGYANKQGLKRFLEKLEVLSKYKEKAKQFPKLIYSYFEDILNSDKIHLSDIPGNSYQANFQLTNFNVPKELKMKTQNEYAFTFNEDKAYLSWFRIRLHECLIQKPEHVIQGLEFIKKELKRNLRRSEMINEVTNEPTGKSIKEYTPDEYFFYKHLVEFYNIRDEKILKQTYQSLIRMGYLVQRTR